MPDSALLWVSAFFSDRRHNTAIEEAVDSWCPALYRFAMVMSACEADAASLTIETFSMLGARNHEMTDSHELARWLFSTLYRKILDRNKSQSSLPVGKRQTPVADVRLSYGTADDPLCVTRVIDALRLTGDQLKAVLTLFYLDRFSYTEIAEILNLPAEVIISRVTEGRRLLRKFILGDPLLTAGLHDSLSTRRVFERPGGQSLAGADFDVNSGMITR